MLWFDPFFMFSKIGGFSAESMLWFDPFFGGGRQARGEGRAKRGAFKPRNTRKTRKKTGFEQKIAMETKRLRAAFYREKQGGFNHGWLGWARMGKAGF
jgi:hypothetical protein